MTQVREKIETWATTSPKGLKILIVVQQRNLRFREDKMVEAENLAKELITEFRKVYHIK